MWDSYVCSDSLCNVSFYDTSLLRCVYHLLIGIIYYYTFLESGIYHGNFFRFIKPVNSPAIFIADLLNSHAFQVIIIKVWSIMVFAAYFEFTGPNFVKDNGILSGAMSFVLYQCSSCIFCKPGFQILVDALVFVVLV